MPLMIRKTLQNHFGQISFLFIKTNERSIVDFCKAAIIHERLEHRTFLSWSRAWIGKESIDEIHFVPFGQRQGEKKVFRQSVPTKMLRIRKQAKISQKECRKRLGIAKRQSRHFPQQNQPQTVKTRGITVANRRFELCGKILIVLRVDAQFLQIHLVKLIKHSDLVFAGKLTGARATGIQELMVLIKMKMKFITLASNDHRINVFPRDFYFLNRTIFEIG